MKKFIITLLTAALAAAMLTACNGNVQITNDTAQNNSISSSAGDSEEYSVDAAADGDDLDWDETEASAENESGDTAEESGDTADSDELKQAFIGTWSPYAAYTESQEKVSPKEIFGSSFRFGGTITFNEDGSVQSTLLNEEGKQSGTFTTQGNTLTLVYSGGEEITMELTGYPNSSTLEQHITANRIPCTVYYTK